MDADLELDGWRQDWQSGGVAPANLGDRVARETRRMRQFLLAEIAITLVFGGGSIAWATVSRRSELLVLVVGIWAFLAMAWATSSWLRRGVWTPLTMRTSAFLDLSILRCRRRREAIFAQAALYLAILSFTFWWIRVNGPYAGMDGWTFLTGRSVVWVWPMTAVLAAVSVRQHRRLGRELETLTTLQQAFEYDDDGKNDDGKKELRSWPVRTSGGRRLKSRKPAGWKHGGN